MTSIKRAVESTCETSRVAPLACAMVAALALSCGATHALAGPHTAAAREAAEAVLRKFGKELGEEGAETVAARLEALAVQYGDDALVAERKAGPRAMAAVEHAGASGGTAAKLLARYGDEGLWIVEQPSRLRLAAQGGDEAAAALLKHKGVADAIVAGHGQTGARAIVSLADARSARRLAMMESSGELAKIGKTNQLLEVVSRYGDRGMDFVWRNKGALMVGTGLTAFLANPQPFLDGTRDLAEVAAQNVVGPAVEGVSTEAARRLNWTWFATLCVAALAGYASFRYWLKHRAADLRTRG